MRYLTFLLLLVTCHLTYAADNQPPAGFTALFNGKDFSGWEGSVQIDKRLSMAPQELADAQAKANS